MVASKEMVWDDTLDSGVEFTDVTESTAGSSITTGNYYHITDGRFRGYYYCNLTLPTALIDTDYAFNQDNNIIRTNGTIYLTRWDGNGFGDSNEFEQLIDGTDTDDNGNIVKTDISYIPLNYKMEN